MKIAYASRTGNVEALVGKLGADALKIESGAETIAEDYILFTYTDGYGDIPGEVEAFLAGNAAHLKGVVCSGDRSYGEAYCQAGDKIAEQYGVTCLYKLEFDGTDEDVEKIKGLIA